MDIELLRYFIKISETLSFHTASKELFTAQSTLSRKIQNLETELGIQLFDRTTRKVNITDGGLQILENARRIVSDYDDMLLKIRGLNGISAGSIKIGYFRDETAEYMARLVEQMHAKYPAVQLQYMKRDLTTLLQSLHNAKLDAIMVYQPCVTDDLKYERISVAHEYPSLIVHQTHPLAERNGITNADLINETVVIARWDDIPSEVNQTMADFFQNTGIQVETLSYRFNWGEQMMRIRLNECVMIDPFATTSIGIPAPFRMIPVLTEDPLFDREIIMLKDNHNPLLFSLKRTVEDMIKKKAF